ncbi:MAG: chromophore lyase CpcT/CpeT [Bacteroidia bacterium]
MRTAVVVLFLVFFQNIGKAQFNKELLEVAKMMQGSYSSKKQSKKDSAFFDIRLKIVPIWKERTDAIWFYVEQAVASMQDKPYRQRVYRLTGVEDGSFESAVYTLNSPLRFVGHVDLVESLNPDSLALKEGCSVFLKKDGKKKYVGGTGDKTCPSDMRGASYASSIVTLTPKYLLSWDRGYNREGAQVWGAEKGGYMFRKIKK